MCVKIGSVNYFELSVSCRYNLFHKKTKEKTNEQIKQNENRVDR